MPTPQKIESRGMSASARARKIDFFGMKQDTIQSERKKNEETVNGIEDCFFITQLSS